MARHPASRRVHRRPSEPDDVFVEGVLESSVWLRTHGRTIVIAVAALMLVTLGFLYWRSSRAAMRERAATELTTLRQTVQAGNPAVAIREIESFLASFGGTAAADEARLMLARAQLEAGQPQQAIDAVRDLASDLDNPMGSAAAFLLGSAHEALSQFDQAESIYIRLGENARFDYQRAQGIENAARVRLEQGNPAGAAELYDRLLTTLPESSPQRAVYEMRRAEALALANRTPAS